MGRFFSFEDERRGVARVVALDHLVWCLHTPKQHQYVERCRQEGVQPKPCALARFRTTVHVYK